MFDDIRHQWKLRRFQKQQEDTRRKYDEITRKARKAGEAGDEVLAIRHEALLEDDLHNESIETLQSRYLISKARRYVLPTPALDLKSEITDRWRLSLHAQEALAFKIDEHERRRRERLHVWIKVLAGLLTAGTGLIGAVIGLVVVLR